MTAPSFVMEDIVLRTLKANVSAADLALAKSAMETLGKLPHSSRARMLFESNSTATSHNPPQRPSHHGNFQVLVGDQSASGELSVVFGMFFFYAHKNHHRFLWQAVSSKDVQMQAQRNAYVLNEDVYATLRDAITQELGDEFNALVAAINTVEHDALVV